MAEGSPGGGITATPSTTSTPDTESGGTYTGLPYTQRKIDVTITTGLGAYGEQSKSSVTLRGYRVAATITRVPGQQGDLSLRIYGMNFSLMKQVITKGVNYAGARAGNGVLVEAGDDQGGMFTVFEGSIQDAYFDGKSQPEVAIQIRGKEGGFEYLKPAPVISQPGSFDVANAMQSLAKQMGKQFENHNVVAKLRDVYYPGTALQQANRIAEHAGINMTLENGVLAIWPRGQSRDKGAIPLFSKENGMKEYPIFNNAFIVVESLFRPIYQQQRVAIKSSLFDNKLQYCTPSSYTHTLESEAPGGPWFTTFMALYENPQTPS